MLGAEEKAELTVRTAPVISVIVLDSTVPSERITLIVGLSFKTGKLVCCLASRSPAYPC